METKMSRVHFDFETYSEVKLRDVGPWAYSCHPSTEVLCMSWVDEHSDQVKLWTPDQEKPEWVDDDTVELHGWNVFFEICIMRNTLGWIE